MCLFENNVAVHEKQKVGVEQPEPAAAHHTITTVRCAEPIHLVHDRLRLLATMESRVHNFEETPSSLQRPLASVCAV